MKFRFLVILGIILAFGSVDSGCSKGGKGKKNKVENPKPTSSPSEPPSVSLTTGSTAAGGAAVKSATDSMSKANELVGSEGEAQTGAGAAKQQAPAK